MQQTELSTLKPNLAVEPGRIPMKLNLTKNLSEEDALEVIGSWVLLGLYTLADMPDFKFTLENISQKLGISKSEAEKALDTLIRVGLFEKSEVADRYKANPLVIDDSVVPSADLLMTFNRLSAGMRPKLTSKDCFGHLIESINRKVILKNLPEIYSLISKLADESKGIAGNEVYSFEFSFTRLSRTKAGVELI